MGRHWGYSAGARELEEVREWKIKLEREKEGGILWLLAAGKSQKIMSGKGRESHKTYRECSDV